MEQVFRSILSNRTNKVIIFLCPHDFSGDVPVMDKSLHLFAREGTYFEDCLSIQGIMAVAEGARGHDKEIVVMGDHLPFYPMDHARAGLGVRNLIQTIEHHDTVSLS